MRPAWSARFFAVGKPYRARFDYPGVVSALDRNTGELIAKSRPGRPAEIDCPPTLSIVGASIQPESGADAHARATQPWA